ncbi:hypothetical protein HID58_013604, partial [Brassica napus]
FSGFDDGVNAFQFVATGLLLCGWWSLTGLTSLISRSVEIGVFFLGRNEVVSLPYPEENVVLERIYLAGCALGVVEVDVIVRSSEGDNDKSRSEAIASLVYYYHG